MIALLKPVACGILAVNFLASSSQSLDWNYVFNNLTNGPLAWGDISPDYAECSGTMQSPINIDFNTPLDGFDEFRDELEELGIAPDGRTFLTQWDWNGRFIHHFKVTNSKNSITFSPIDPQGNSLSGSDKSIARLTNMFADETDSGSQFCLDSFHFHWGEHDTDGSEHTQYGVQYPAEIHFVHYSCDFADLGEALDYAFGNSLTDSYVLAVVGFLFEIDDDASIEEISAFEELLQDIDNIENDGDETILLDVNLVGSFIPSDMQFVANEEYTKVSLSDSTMWYYEGSLTTPGCFEIVRWHVFDYKLKITSEMLEEFRDLEGPDGTITQNWRPIQDNENDVYVFEFDNDDTSSSSSSSRSSSSSKSSSRSSK